MKRSARSLSRAPAAVTAHGSSGAAFACEQHDPQRP